MKKLFSISLFLMAGIVLLSSCTKTDYYNEWNDYKNDESGIVTYVSEVNSPYSVVRLDYDGMYAIIYSIDKNDNLWPYKKDVLYGDFSKGATRKVYNKSLGKSIKIDVDDFFKYESDAINAVIRREDNEGYVSAFKQNAVKLQMRTGERIAVGK